jgi:hypothetical protein
MAKSVSTPKNQQSVKTFYFFALVQSSSFRFGVFSFVPKTPIFAFKTRLNQPSTDYQNEKNKTISNY